MTRSPTVSHHYEGSSHFFSLLLITLTSSSHSSFILFCFILTSLHHVFLSVSQGALVFREDPHTPLQFLGALHSLVLYYFPGALLISWCSITSLCSKTSICSILSLVFYYFPGSLLLSWCYITSLGL